MRPTVATWRCCPACARRYAMQVDLNCPICGGAGLIALGPKAPRRDTAEQLRRIEIAIEMAANEALAANPAHHQGVTAAANAIGATIGGMRLRQLTIGAHATLATADHTLTTHNPAHRKPHKPPGHTPQK